VREQTVIIFQNFTQESVECEDGAYRVSLGYGGMDTGGSFGDVLAYRGRG